MFGSSPSKLKPGTSTSGSIMKLLLYLFRTARGVMVLTAATALVSGACYAGLIAVVNSQLDRPATIRFSLMACFIGLALGKILTTMISQMILARFSQGAIAKLRQDLVRKILAGPWRHWEQIGAAPSMSPWPKTGRRFPRPSWPFPPSP